MKTIRALPLAARRAFSIAAHHHETEPGLAVLPEDYRQIETTIRACLRDVLGLSETRVAQFTEDTPLFGALPELDSMAVAGLLTEIEERLGILIEDDEVDGEMLESFGALVRFAVAHTPR